MSSSSSNDNGIVKRALSSLGKGFDLTSDFRLKYCKGKHSLVLLHETQTKYLQVPGFGSFSHVSTDINCAKGDRIRYQSDILDFNQVLLHSYDSLVYVSEIFSFHATQYFVTLYKKLTSYLRNAIQWEFYHKNFSCQWIVTIWMVVYK